MKEVTAYLKMRKIKSPCCSASHALAVVAVFSVVYLIYKPGPTFIVNDRQGHIAPPRQVKQRVAQLIVVREMGTNSSHDKKEDDGTKVNTAIPAYRQNIFSCSCSRKFMYSSPPNDNNKDVRSQINIVNGRVNFPRLNSSCSDEGTHYQSGQNVISMSLWLPRNATSIQTRNYQMGILHNLERMRKHYSGHSLRLYTNLPLNPGGFYCNVLCKSEDLFWCDITNVPSHGNLGGMDFRSWRFLTLGDPTVNIFHSRDLDSLISYREADAVKDWLSKKDHKAVMLMRDREFDHNIPILGGMWGADNTKMGISVGSGLREQIVMRSKHQRKGKFLDQHILYAVVFYPLLSPSIRGDNATRDIVAYDAYNCVKWSKFTEVRPFPTQKRDPDKDFVAYQVDFVGGARYSTFAKEVCPVECRPDYGKNWTYC